jgi:hypothetical protein
MALLGLKLDLLTVVIETVTPHAMEYVSRVWLSYYVHMWEFISANPEVFHFRICFIHLCAIV